MAIVERNVCGPGQAAALKSMFMARKRVFVDLLRWDVPVIDGRFEIDQFDDPSAVYILIVDPDGGHLGSARLLETTKPHILASLFPQLCEGAVPSGPDMLEITRFCLDPRLGASARLNVRNRLVSALVAHALASGIRTYTGVAELAWLQQILAFGWDCQPLGSPQRVGGKQLGALAIAIGPETPALLARNGLWVEETLAPATLSKAA